MTTEFAIQYTWGIAAHGLYRADPPRHIIWDGRTWCGGGKAYDGMNNVSGRRCPRCLALAREEATRWAE